MTEFRVDEESGTGGRKPREELYSHVLRLSDLIGYQKGVVASRMILSKKTGSVTLFAFDENEGLSEHTAPFDALVMVVEGECDISVCGKTERLTIGESILLPAHKPHALSAISRFKMILVMIKDDDHR